MRLVKATVRAKKMNGETAKFLQEFIDSGELCMMVEGVEKEYVSINSARNHFVRVIARENMKIRTSISKGNLYLIRL